MEMKKISSGKLRAIGYDARQRLLQVQLDDGTMLQYSGVGEEAWRRLRTASSPWSDYRDNIEEAYTVKAVKADAAGAAPGGEDASAPGKNPPGKNPPGKNPLDELFRPPD